MDLAQPATTEQATLYDGWQMERVEIESTQCFILPN